MSSVTITDFTRFPGPRFRSEGPHSGEEFRDRFLAPLFAEAQSKGERLTVILDGVTFGYPTSFLEEAFGGLARRVGDPQEVLRVLDLHSEEEPGLVEEIRRYIQSALQTSVQRATS